MNTKHLGDSFDIVKRFLLGTLAPLGEWTTDPMFTDQPTKAQARSFSQLLGTPLVRSRCIPDGRGRSAYFEGCPRTGNLFLDPDTGLRLAGSAKRTHLTAGEMEKLVRGRPLTLVFDQSVRRAQTPSNDQIVAKLQHFKDVGISGLAYVSHASFLLLSTKPGLIRKARTLLLKTGLPPDRLVDA